ncbi:MAG: shikimate kinase [candidate division Zixibacteria bacterium]|nr:shikimate kinase [candidate division Zixibacteria bacterium]
MTTPHTTKRHIWLVGFSGSGKSTVGPKLARALNMAFADTDAMAERMAGITVEQIFETRGEKLFRLLERQAIAQSAIMTKPTVIALGGGAYHSAFHRAVIRKHGFVVYLSANVSTIYRRLKAQAHLDRPLLRIPARSTISRSTAQKHRIAELLAIREKNYRRADIVVSTNAKSPAQVVKSIISQMKALHG